MSINKGKTKEIVRHCAEHGIMCKCKRSFAVNKEAKKNRWSDLKVDGVKGKKYIKK